MVTGAPTLSAEQNAGRRSPVSGSLAAGSWLRRGIALLALIALCVIAGAVFARLYSGPRLMQLLVAAAVFSVAISVVGRVARVNASATIVVSLAAMGGYLLAATVVTRPVGAGGVGALFSDALRNSGARILTSTIPIDATPDTVVLPIAALWLAGLLGAELLVRRGAALAAVGGPTAVYALALVFIGPNARPSPWWAMGYVTTAVVCVAAQSRGWARPAGQLSARDRRSYQARRTAITAGALAVLLAGTAVLGPALADLSHRQPADPRAHVKAPQQRLPEGNPLARLGGWAKEPNQPLFTVKTASPSRIQWVVLTDYNGLTWNPGNEYRSAGSVLPARGKLPGARGVRQEFTMLGLDGVWLPAINQARQVTNVRIAYDPATGTLLYPQGMKTGLSYQISSSEPHYDVAALGNAGLSSSDAMRRYALIPPQVPSDVDQLARDITQHAGTPYQQALLLEQYLRQNYTFTPDAPAGHGLPNLRFFLTTDKDAGGHRGTSEQFATSFALLARIVGLPTRVVVGFHGGQKQGSGKYLVRSGDAFAWPEVNLAGYGWVPFDPTPPQGKDTPVPPEENTSQAKQQQQEKQQQLNQLQQPDQKRPSSKGTPRAADRDSGGGLREHAGLISIVSLIVAVVVLTGWLVGVVLARRALRRRRLRTGAAPDRMVGAWLEVLDALRLAGHWPGRTATAAEVAAAAAAGAARGRGDGVVMGAGPSPSPLPSVAPIADGVNAVTFAPGWLAEAGAARAGEIAQEYVSALRQSHSWLRRIVWTISPRPLWWERARKRSAKLPAAPRRVTGTYGLGTLGLAPPPSREVHAGSDGATASLESTVTTWKQ